LTAEIAAMQDSRPAWPRPLLGLIVALAGPGCATLGDRGQTLIPTRYQTRTGPYAVFTNFPIEPGAPTIRSLQSLGNDIEAGLGIRVDPEEPPVEVYILDDRRAFTHFLTFHYPELPPRRAFFLAQGDRRVVYTILGDRLEEDLRHEATHALLHVAVGVLPLWLDEGLAEYFEGPEGRRGVNSEHLGRLSEDLASGWKPDLAKLEALQTVRQMSPRDYRESWAWAHYLLNGTEPGKVSLLAYLAEIRTKPDARPLAERLGSEDVGSSAHLLAHLDRVRSPSLAGSPPASEPIVRMQDHPLKPARAPGPRRGFFGRFRSLFGL
jgi:hypothetical protein